MSFEFRTQEPSIRLLGCRIRQVRQAMEVWKAQALVGDRQCIDSALPS